MERGDTDEVNNNDKNDNMVEGQLEEDGEDEVFSWRRKNGQKEVFSWFDIWK